MEGLTWEERNVGKGGRTEDTLWESEPRLRRIYEKSPVPYQSLDGKGRILDVNAAWLDLLGYTHQEVLGCRLDRFFTPQSRIAFEEKFRRFLECGTTHGSEFEVRCKNGDILTIAFDGVFVRDAKGSPLYTHCILYNVTERRFAQEALREALLWQKEAVRAAKVGLWDWDLLTNKVSYSAEWKRQIGHEEGEITDAFEEWKSRVHPEDLETTLDRVMQSIEKRKPDHQTEFRFRHKDGSYRWILAQASVLQDERGRPIRMLGSHVDITERKQAMEALRESEGLYRTVVESTTDAIVVLDMKRNIVSCNHGFFTLFGYLPKDVKGKAIRLIHPSEEAYRKFGETAYPLIEKTGSYRSEVNLTKKDGTVFPAETVTSVMKHLGAVSGYVGIIRDITGRKRAQEERERLQSQFYHAQKMEAVGTLTGGVAHDFNNILTAIIGNADLALADLGKDSPLGEYVSEIRAAGKRAADLTRQLLAFSRKQVLQPEVFNMNKVVGEMDNMLRRLIGEDIELVTILAPDLGLVEADAGQLEQVILNLAVNARDAMPGGGKLTLETANMDLDEEYAGAHVAVTPGPYVMLCVSDTGSGMSKEVQAKVFEPFFTTKDKGKGTGLGLATVYGIVKQSKGNIWVYSEQGKGSVFKIYLPRKYKAEEKKKEKHAATVTRGGNETILIVEDDAKVRTLAMKVLESYGYRVLSARNGREALETSRGHQGPIHLMLTDVVMPGMSGRELAEGLHGMRPETKVLYMSGYTDNAIVHHGILDKGIAFVQKPFTPEDLARKVREVFEEVSTEHRRG